LITVEHLTKEYGKRKAVDDIGFTIPDGEIVGFLGPNGAGKTTTMNIITGYISATSGSVVIDGLDILENPEEVKRKIGYLPEQPPLYGDMTVDEYLGFVAELRGIPKKERSGARDEAMELVAVADVRTRLIKNLSKGYRQRIGLAQALIAKPRILILDEPTVGLDPKQIAEIRDLISKIGKERTVILSSHILPEVSAVCHRVMIIDRGRIIADGKPEMISSGLEGRNRVSVRVACAKSAEAKTLLEGIAGIETVTDSGSIEDGSFDFVVEAKPEADVRKDIFFALSKASLPLLGMRVVDLTLEEVFLRLTTREGEEA